MAQTLHDNRTRKEPRSNGRGFAVSALLALSLMAAKAPDASCWFDASTLHAINLTPGEIRLGIDSPWPNGSVYWSYDGTITIPLTLSPGTHAAYVTERGGGKSLVRLGRQWGDYHVVAICSTTIGEAG